MAQEVIISIQSVVTNAIWKIISKMDKMAKKSTINNILQKENKPADEDEDKNVSYEDLLKKMKSKFSDKYNTDIPSSNPNELENLTMLVLLGEGSFGRVVLVKNKTNDKFYAMKIFEKVKIMKAKQLQHTLYEKKMLQSVNFPFIISLEFCMKDNAYLYFVLPFESGGDMFFHMSRMNKFDEELSKFYAAQVLLALEYLHCCDVLYRDLKPENIIISETGYLKLTDLGFCKVVKSRTWTFCGTPEYIAPELILSKGYGKSVDWWSFGVLIFEMNAGFSPFYAKDPMVIYEKITNGKYKEPMHFSLHLKDIIRNLLQVDMSKRFGNMKNGVEDIKKHAWFNNVDFLNIFFKRVQPPFVPTTAKPDDISNFDVKKVRPLKKSSQELFKEEFDLF